MSVDIIIEPLEALEKHFGFSRFLAGQSEVVESILSGRDGLVVMPTGGGKSLCYQLPALCLRGITVVVSPLIALMKDQVDALQQRGVAAVLINSTLSLSEQASRIESVKRGQVKLIYVAPERFKSQNFMRMLKEVKISLFAIDEAHCLSQWGHDFRPDYMRLGAVLNELGKPQCVALTATATQNVRKDILEVLRLTEPFELISGFSRPNLSLAIMPVDKVHQKYSRIKKIVTEFETGIIYCATRKRVEEVAEHLAEMGVSCVAYHGGMSDAEREKTQNIFISKEADVAVATNAFGMGIDRSDVRFVVHFEIPGSVEAYYQEAGRAGRDGESSYCEMLFNYADTRTQEFFIEGANPSYQSICKIYQYLLNHADKDYELNHSIDTIKEGSDVKNMMSVSSAISLLVRNGYVERFDVAQSRTKGTRLLQPNVPTSKLNIDRSAIEQKEKRDREKLSSMVELAYTGGCRQRWILEYFGERNAQDCGNCDNCIGGESDKNAARDLEVGEVLILRKALSGVARMSKKTTAGWEGIFGKGRIVQMLSGSKSQDIFRCRLEQLSTYGILKEQGTAFLNSLFRSLLQAGLVTIQKKEYPLLTITSKGESVMLGKGTCRLVWPAKEGAKRHKSEGHEGVEMTEMGFDQELFEKLRETRLVIAQKANVPAFHIFTNNVLEQLARLQPKSEEHAMSVSGIGKQKAEKYLDLFLRVIKNHKMGL